MSMIVDEKSYGNILIYDISYKTLIGAKPLRIRVDKVNGFIRVYHETRCLLSLGSEKYDAIYSMIRYFTPQKSVITYVFFS